ncbi:MAG: SDR family NAD(P)-dependent oxidoreductase, partial [Muribaculaceae bacterium]|nr:SDR family NAD(P)-dependent oxidoreductase [Muribaculaceae bacterium]
MNELFSVKDKVVVITGGTGVLGACIGRHLAHEGAKVVLMGRRKDEGDK